MKFDQILTSVNCCPVCSSSNTVPFFTQREKDISKGGQDYLIFEELALPPQKATFDLCKECGFIYMNPRWNSEGLGLLYGERNIYRVTSVKSTLSVNEYTKELDLKFKKYLDPGISDPNYINPHHKANLDFIRKSNSFAPHSRVLDVGCGFGAAQQAISQCGFDYVGVDSAPELIEFGRSVGRNLKEVPFLHLGEKFLAYADVVYTSDFLEHVDEPLECLKILKECIKPGGYLFVYVPGFTYLQSMNWGHISHFYHVSLGNVMRLAGFQLCRYEYVYNYRGIRMLAKKVDDTLVKMPPLVKPDPSQLFWEIKIKGRVNEIPGDIFAFMRVLGKKTGLSRIIKAVLSNFGVFPKTVK